MTPLVLKLGGELVETAAQRANVAAALAAASRRRPVVVVHGGGRAIDAELARRHIAPAKVEGLRITDRETLDVVIAVLGGTANTELVAACVAAGVPAVGLTGADAGFARAVRSSAHRTSRGDTVDLGFVGDPVGVDAALLNALLAAGYVPVVASLGLETATDDGRLPAILNVNADVMACRIAAALSHCDLVIAGTTAGVLDRDGSTIADLDLDGVDRLIGAGTATAGMIAKLASCRAALDAGVARVRIVDGRGFGGTSDLEAAPGTTLLPAHAAAGTAEEPTR
ncbi:MAG: acetylglutamate kinase [Acidobacteria bacterium]|nr:acetylglutamate kinase [Acidobacteriota bacterium]